MGFAEGCGSEKYGNLHLQRGVIGGQATSTVPTRYPVRDRIRMSGAPLGKQL